MPADSPGMRWISRHALPTSIVVVAFATVVAVFVFARPDANAARTEAVVRMADERHLARAEVVRAFAVQHIRLIAGPRLGKGRIYGDGHPGDSFTVTIFAKDAVVHFGLTGPKVLVERRIGNAEIFYGGHDQRFADRISAASASLH